MCFTGAFTASFMPLNALSMLKLKLYLIALLSMIDVKNLIYQNIIISLVINESLIIIDNDN